MDALDWLNHNSHNDQLLWGLQLLDQLDASTCLNVALPQLYLFAKQDTLVPIAASAAIKERWPLLQIESVTGSHAFTVSQSSWIAERIHSFLTHYSDDAKL